MTDTQFSWYMVVNSLVAAGTIGAVLAPLFGEALRGKYFPPTFRMNILKPGGEACPISDQAGHHVADGRYYHLNVRNTRRWAARVKHFETPGIRIY
jgi:hypothetical protein